MADYEDIDDANTRVDELEARVEELITERDDANDRHTELETFLDSVRDGVIDLTDVKLSNLTEAIDALAAAIKQGPQ